MNSPMNQYYRFLLQRYARRLVKEETVAAAIAGQALEDLAHTEGLPISKELRGYLKTDVYNRCWYWKQAQLFDRRPVAVPVSKFSHKQQYPAIEP